MHLLQLQPPGGLLSNEFLLYVEAPTVFESTDPQRITTPPGVAVGTADTTPFDHPPLAGQALLFYQVVDCAGLPDEIFMTKGVGGNVLIHF